MLIGIDIGGTNLKSAIVDENGIIHQQDSIKTNIIHLSSLISDVINIIDIYCRLNSKINAVGIGVPGVVNKSGTIVVSPNLPNLNGINLLEEIKNNISLPLFLDNDANVAGIAELVAGNGKEFNDFIYVTLGTGIGGAIILNRNIMKGSIGGAGEIGHTIIYCEEKDNILSYRKGTLEELAGKNQIIKRMKKILSINGQSINDNQDVKDISRLADEGEKYAIQCLNETGFYIGVGIASAMNLLDIPNVIIGGGISESSDVLFKSIIDTISLRTLPSISDRIIVKKALFRKNTGVIGAALYAHQMINRGDNE